MSSIKVSFGKVLGTINTAANTATSTLDSISTGMDMLNNRIQAEASKQRQDIDLELAEYGIIAQTKVAQSLTEHTVEVQKFTSQSPDHKKYFDEYMAKLDSRLNKS